MARLFPCEQKPTAVLNMKFCIVGTGRCGTRLLYNMLNGHPDLFVFNETHWIPKLYEVFGTTRFETEEMLDIVKRTRHVTGARTTEFSEAAFLSHFNHSASATVAELCDALGGFFAHQNGKNEWADKTPDYGPFASQLQTYWPGCKIIHLIRDGAAVAGSMSKHIGYKGLASLRRYNWCSLSLDYVGNTEGFPPQPMQAFADLWYHRLVRTRDEASRLRPGTYLEIRHEDIIHAPAKEIGKLAEFVGLRQDAAWIESVGSFIESKRVAKSRPIEVLEHFNDRQLRLLDELGYGTNKS